MKASRALMALVAAAAVLAVLSGGSYVGAAGETIVAELAAERVEHGHVLGRCERQWGDGVHRRDGRHRSARGIHDVPPLRPDQRDGTGGPGPGARLPHPASLNPGGQTFVVTVRFRADYTGRNLMQKGQSTTVGGFWKVEWEGGTGRARCLFRGPAGDSVVKERRQHRRRRLARAAVRGRCCRHGDDPRRCPGGAFPPSTRGSSPTTRTW